MSKKPEFQIFRNRDGVDLMQSGHQDMAPATDVQNTGITQMVEAGLMDGAEVRVIADVPGLNLVHIWFKKDYPLPLHSHNVDCLYYIVAGAITLGTEHLGPRDSFFIPADAPYTYRTGPQGVEILEIRAGNHWDFKNHAQGQAFYDQALTTIAAKRKEWREAPRPALNT